MSTQDFAFPPPPPPPPVTAQQGSFIPYPGWQGHRSNGYDNARNRGGYGHVHGQGRGRGTWSSRGSIGGRGRGAVSYNAYPYSLGNNGRGGYAGQGQYHSAGLGHQGSHALQTLHGSQGGGPNGLSTSSAPSIGRGNGYQNSNIYNYSNTLPIPNHQATKQGFRHITQSKIAAPPAVPAFGAPLPGLSSGAADKALEPLKKKRKYNQLGLTPKTEEHESSEEEDVDEEAKLAAVIRPGTGLAQNQLQFTYKGQQANLASPSEIAAWIEERKKRYPTKKRAEEAAERKRKQHEADSLAREQRKQSIPKNKTRTTEIQSLTSEKTTKARVKAEKLRKQYEKAQKRVAELEARPSTADRPRSETHKKSSDSNRSLRQEEVKKGYAHMPLSDGAVAIITSGSSSPAEVLVGTTQGPGLISQNSETISSALESALSQNEAFEKGLDKSTLGVEVDSLEDTEDCSSTISSSSLSDDDRETSSSGSSEDDAPFQTTSKSQFQERVLAQQPSRPKAVCRVFLAKGYCPKGERCQYRHELPERGSRMLQGVKEKKRSSARHDGTSKRERLSLYQRMLAQQNEQEDEVALKHIIFLGEQGLLDDPST